MAAVGTNYAAFGAKVAAAYANLGTVFTISARAAKISTFITIFAATGTNNHAIIALLACVAKVRCAFSANALAIRANGCAFCAQVAIITKGIGTL